MPGTGRVSGLVQEDDAVQQLLPAQPLSVGLGGGQAAESIVTGRDGPLLDQSAKVVVHALQGALAGL